MPEFKRDAETQPSVVFTAAPTSGDRTGSAARDLARAVARTFAAMINVDVVGVEALHLRHDNGQRAILTADDILEGRLRVVDPRTREACTYEHVEALVVAGWSVIA